VFGNRYNVGASDFGNSDTTVGLVCGIEVNVVRSDTSSDGELEVLSLSQALGREVSRVEAVSSWSVGEAMKK
jgi:hypothetical protein